MRTAFAHEAILTMDTAADLRAPGGAVTIALCGAWEHEPPCRWPHNNELGSSGEFRTLFIAPAGEEAEVRERIAGALAVGPGWHVLRARARDVLPGERELAERLAN